MAKGCVTNAQTVLDKADLPSGGLGKTRFLSRELIFHLFQALVRNLPLTGTSPDELKDAL